MRYFLYIVLISLIGCQASLPQLKQTRFKTTSISTTIKDGAPLSSQTASFKEVKPQYEPLSRYGNPDSYKVDGQTYQILRTARGYKAHGIASWYGTKFHSQRTSSGDDYDMYTMTAAHKTLPLPTYVRVKNLSNGRTVIVKVNDRGPFHNDRIIDLSYAAGSKLGILPHGTAPVEIEALSDTTHSSLAQYYLQAGAFSSEKLANQLQKRLKSMTASPILIEKYQQRYIVRIGPFSNKTATDVLKRKFISKGIEGVFSLLQ